MPVQCTQCDAELTPPYKFCGVCGAAQPALNTSPEPTSWHYSGPSGQDSHETAAVIALVVADPEADHHLWTEGWDGWRSWQEVASIAEAVNAELAIRAEDPAAVAEYERVLHEMLADGVLEAWEQEVLDGLRAEKGISQATHDRLVQGYQPVRTALVAIAVDAHSTRGFRAGQFCVLRLKVRNESSVGLRRARVYAASSTFEGVVTVDSPRIAPSADEAVLLRMQPQVAGQHELHALVAAMGYTGTPSWYRVRPTVFSVGAAPGERGTQVYNMDLSSMQVGKVGQVGGSQADSSAGLATEASWVPLSLAPVTPGEARAWLQSRGAELPEELREEEAPSAPVPPPKSTAPAVAERLHYSGPSGQEELDHAAIAERISRDVDADHHLWQAGWNDWKDWRDVDPISALVDGLLATHIQPASNPTPKPASDPRALQVELAKLLARAAQGGLRLRPPTKLTAAWLAKATATVDERLGASKPSSEKPTADKPSGRAAKKKRAAWRDVGKTGGMVSYVTDMGRELASLDKQLYMKTATAGERAIRRFIQMSLELTGHFALRNFGSLRVVLRPAWEGCNPATGRPMRHPAKKTVLFRPSHNTQARPLPKGQKRLKVRAEWKQWALSANEPERLSFWAWTARAHLGTDPKKVVREVCDLSIRRRMAWFVHVDTGMKLSLACRVVRAWELVVRQNLYTAKTSFWGGGGNGRVCLYGVGTLRVERRAELFGRNPMTGRALKVPAKDVVRFRVSGALSYDLNR